MEFNYVVFCLMADLWRSNVLYSFWQVRYSNLWLIFFIILKTKMHKINRIAYGKKDTENLKLQNARWGIRCNLTVVIFPPFYYSMTVILVLKSHHSLFTRLNAIIRRYFQEPYPSFPLIIGTSIKWFQLFELPLSLSLSHTHTHTHIWAWVHPFTFMRSKKWKIPSGCVSKKWKWYGFSPFLVEWSY